METTHSAVLAMDDQGDVTHAAGALESFGLGPDAVGCAWRELFQEWPTDAPVPGDGTRGARYTEAITRGGQPVVVEFLQFPVNGVRTLAVLSRPQVPTPNSRQRRYYALGEISAGVAHEMNNALTLLRGWLELMLSDAAEDATERPTLELLVTEAGRIGQLTRNLLDVARSDAGNGRALDLNQLLDEMLCLVRNEMKTANIDLAIEVDADLPRVRGNAGRLKQALLNLLVNARQAMPQGGRARLAAAHDGNGQVCITVADSGPGIPADVLPSIFAPFYTTKREGTGLGLSVTREIIQEHGGTVSVQSDAGVGTQFVIKLPIR